MQLRRLLILGLFAALPAYSQKVTRLSQLGFRPEDHKSAVILSTERITGQAARVREEATGNIVLAVSLNDPEPSYGRFPYTFTVDLTSISREGEYSLLAPGADAVQFRVFRTAFTSHREAPLFYLAQQRCGYNPVYDTLCHTTDGVIVAGPGEGTRVDASGGYHDASDYLRFLITTSYTSGILMMAYKEFPQGWRDSVDGLGKSGANGIPDVMDEARWGLEWMLKLAPAPGVLYHQVADDRDHIYAKFPWRDTTDYGWGKANGRPVYPATGAPQGLGKYQNTSTGVANVAGRTAAVFALGSFLWSQQGWDAPFALKLAERARDLYELGLAKPGCSESVPNRAPYRFHEITWHDDMEWGAAELYRLTREPRYLQDALRWASLAADTSWMGKDTARHYEYFPYVNLGHYAVYEFAPASFRDSLRAYFKRGLERAQRAAQQNAFGYGVPLIWVSNNVNLGLITQAILYRRMGGDDRFDALAAASRDWLFGRNPWGQSFVVGVPADGSTPKDIHHVMTRKVPITATGAVVDGPVFGSIYGSLLGLHLTEPDEFAAFQSQWAVYHDDYGDYSTNEPTIDASAALVFVLAAMGE
ncbi:MAG: glycoside hydrolase family 9 protein [Bacteroidota bacterium]